jgi:hypothetical protein
VIWSKTAAGPLGRATLQDTAIRKLRIVKGLTAICQNNIRLAVEVQIQSYLQLRLYESSMILPQVKGEFKDKVAVWSNSWDAPVTNIVKVSARSLGSTKGFSIVAANVQEFENIN